MKRRSFIQGVAALLGAKAVGVEGSSPSVLPSHLTGGKQVDYVDSVVYDISPVENPFMSLKRSTTEWEVDKL